MEVISLRRFIQFFNLIKTAIVHVGTCDTAAGEANKTVTVRPGFKGDPIDGTQILVNFANTNTAPQPQLKIGNSSLPIYVGTNQITDVYQAGVLSGYCHLVYDTGKWVLVSSGIKSRNNVIYTTNAVPLNVAPGTIWLKKKESQQSS